jgi:hypothetical protein
VILRRTASDRVAISVRLRLGLRDAAAGRHAFRQPDIAADRRAAPDRDAAEDRSAGVDDHVVFDDRMARIALAQFAISADLEAPFIDINLLYEMEFICLQGRLPNILRDTM